MTESKAIEKSIEGPVTQQRLINDLVNAGVKPGMNLLVHSSLSAMGWVCGGAVTVIYALEKILGNTGTLIMPTHSSGLSDPKAWENPPVAESWWPIIRKTMPAFNPDITPSQGMGDVPETFRRFPGVIRSLHPQFSFAAKGKHAKAVTVNHSLENSFGEKSPLGELYRIKGHILLLGTTHSSNTTLHLAEIRANYQGKKYKKCGAPLINNDKREWVEYDDLDYDSDQFDKIGKEYEEKHKLSMIKIGYANSLLLPCRSLVDYAVSWFEKR